MLIVTRAGVSTVALAVAELYPLGLGHTPREKIRILLFMEARARHFGCQVKALQTDRYSAHALGAAAQAWPNARLLRRACGAGRAARAADNSRRLPLATVVLFRSAGFMR